MLLAIGCYLVTVTPPLLSQAKHQKQYGYHHLPGYWQETTNTSHYFTPHSGAFGWPETGAPSTSVMFVRHV